MSLDDLYKIGKNAKYPIRTRADLKKLIGNNIITFEGRTFSAEEISVHINEYPIHTAPDLVKFFLKEEDESYNNYEAKLLNEFEAKFEKAKPSTSLVKVNNNKNVTVKKPMPVAKVQSKQVPAKMLPKAKAPVKAAPKKAVKKSKK